MLDPATVFVVVVMAVFIIAGVWFDAEMPRSPHERSYRYRRLLNWFPLGLAYAGFYMGRYNVSAGNVAKVRDQLGVSRVEYGWIITAGFWTYAATAPLTGALTNRIRGSRAVIFACGGSALANLSIGLLFEAGLKREQLLVLIILYSLNIWCQSFGTLAIMKLNSAWYTVEERGVFSGVFNIVLTSGYFLALGTGSWIISTLNWSFLFILPACYLLTVMCFVGAVVREKPPPTPSLDPSLSSFTPGEEIPPHITTTTTTTTTTNAYGTPPEAKKSSRGFGLALLKDGTFVGYLGATFFLSWVRDGLLNWLLAFLTEHHQIGLQGSSTTLMGGAITVGGFIGGISSGYLSDRIFGSRRLPPLLLFTAGQTVSLGSLYLVSVYAVGHVGLASLFVTSSCVFILGNYTLISYTIPTDLGPELAAAGGGLLTCVGYIASGLSGALMGALIEAYGYLAWISTLLAASVLFAVPLVLNNWRQAWRRAKYERLPLLDGGGLWPNSYELAPQDDSESDD